MIDVSRLSGGLLVQAARNAGLVDGQTAHVSVVRHLGGDRFAVSIRGTLFPARSTFPLQVGSSFSARISVGKGGVTVQPLPPPPASAHHLPPGFAGRQQDIARHLLAVGLPLHPDLIRRVARFAESDSSSVRVRLAALLADKGIEPSEELVGRLSELVLGVGGRGGRDSSQEHERRRRRRETPLVVDETDSPNHPIQVFNHFTGKHGHWLLLPVAASHTTGELRGTLQLFYPVDGGSYRRVVVTVREEGGFWAFLWDNPGSAGGAVRVYTDRAMEPDFFTPALESLRKSLLPFRLDVESRLRDGPELATFAIFQSEAIMAGVDKVV